MRTICLRIFAITSFALLANFCNAQQGNNWYFGMNAGISFNTSPPVALLDGAMATEEGCATISDSLGNILFYTDGLKIYNKNHQVMPNGSGLMGHTSSSQSAIIIPKPGSSTLFYVFTADAVENKGRNGYRYSIVDIELDGGFGDVSTKNILLAENCTEKLTATSHANGVDVWIVGVTVGDSSYRAYKLTCKGLDTDPVISKIGLSYVYEPFYAEPVGLMKISPNGKKLATTRILQGGWEIFDFDNATGKLSNEIYIPLTGGKKFGSENRVYGVEFSPNSKFVYVTSECCFGGGKVHQFKIDNYDSVAILNSHYRVDSSYYPKGGLQLGPDNKIYIINESDSTLSVINSPDLDGPACNFNYRAIDLKGRTGFRCLPTFYSGIINNQNTDFTYTASDNCGTINFSATSLLPPPLTWSWNFGDGTKATGQTVSHTFPASSNTYNIILTVTSADTCDGKATKMKAISFNRIYPKAKFSLTGACGNLTVNFSDSSFIAPNAAIIAWQWDFGDGQTSTIQNCSHTFAGFGQYPVRLIVTSSDACQTKDTTTQTVTITPAPITIFDFDKGCLNVPVQFEDSSTVLAGNIVSWNWNFGDGGISALQNPQHSFSSGGLHTVKLKVTALNGCEDSLSKDVLITPKPVADFSNTLGCINVPASFKDLSTIGSGAITQWQWNFNNGSTDTLQNPSILFNTAGSFRISLLVRSQSNCTSDTAYQTITIESKPIADFTIINDCGNKTIQLRDNSAATFGNPVSWYWTLGDGNFSSTQNISHNYSSFGNYTVNFISSTKNGCISDTVTRLVNVRAKPLPEFALPAVCLLDATAQFSNLTRIEDGSNLSYFWKFGDFNSSPNTDTSSVANPQYGYSAAALYSIKLVSTSSNGCADSLTKSFTVNGAVPKADFRIINPSSLCSNQAVWIKDSSTVNFGNITRVKIFWGDGDSTIDNTPLQAPNGRIFSHQYANFGNPLTKDLTITMYSYSGIICVSTISKIVTIHASPEIVFNTLPDVCNEALAFNITAASEKWNLAGSAFYSGNGITDQINGVFDPKLVDPGAHLITYSFITNDGCKADSTKKIIVHPTPLALFSFNSACLPNANIQFTNLSSVNGYSTNQLYAQWNFNDANSTVNNPNTANITNASHYFFTLDTFRVNLLVTSPKGCKNDTIIALFPNVNIYRQPIADFVIDNPKILCEAVPTIFVNTSDSVSSTIKKWTWNFGDGIKDSLQRKPSHLFASAGVYHASLQIENSNGCKSEVVTKGLTIESNPIADFNFDTTCLGKPIQFKDISVNRFGNLVKWQWDFNDGTIASLQNPVHTYSTYKAYNVRLRVETGNGCAAIRTKTISINRVNIYAGRDTSAAINQPIQLQAFGGSTYEWVPSTGLNNSFASNPIATLLQDQIYVVKGITSTGCIGFDSLSIKIFRMPDIYVPNAFTPNGDGNNDVFGPICVGIKSLEYFTVYNRWGQIVFTTKDASGRWNGLDGLKQIPGTFVWVLRGISYDGKIIEKKGTVTLIR